ncbi:MAG: hypothetical protein KJZ80_00480 [Hyphomicrobiaceae bacterium]|nr:hypothetical protein [Hyphomicrobiaceae bacterium]
MIRQAVIGLALAAAALPAAAAEICVTCSGPPAVYRCTVEQASKVERYRHADRVLQLVCITELAAKQGHEKCRVRRSGSEDCIGLERTVSLTGSLEALATRLETEPVEVPADEPDTTAGPVAQPGPPKTVEELARRTASASKDQLQKTGSAVGSAVKKGWGCLASLFQDC